MSPHEGSAEVTAPFTESEIADYLHSHPDFFERHASLLLGLKLPHGVGSVAVSLVERQVSMLRQRNGELDRQLKDLVAVAKFNDALVEKIHRLAIRFMRQRDVSGRLEQFETSLKDDFSAEHAALVLFEPGAAPDSPPLGFVQRIDRQNAALKPFAAFLRAARPRCGPITEHQRMLVFSSDIASAALVPLGDGAQLGFLVIGSKDPKHFHPGKRMDYLGRLGELVEVAVESGQSDIDRS